MSYHAALEMSWKMLRFHAVGSFPGGISEEAVATRGWGRQQLEAKRSSEITCGAGWALLCVWLSLGISIPLGDVECFSGR